MAFQQGLSGLSASARNLDVIGHNIANSNTTGFKSSRTEFSSMVASAIGMAGGKNSGIGVETAAIAQQFTQGNLTVTGNNLDVAVNGNGFFTLQMPDGSRGYTRDGSFKLDANGNLVTNGGARVVGYPTDKVTGTRTSSVLGPLSFPTTAPIPAKQTEKITAAFNLDARAHPAAGDPDAKPPVPATPRSTYGTSLNVYDSQGVATPLNLYFQKTEANTWEVYTGLDDLEADPPVQFEPIGTLVFDENGKLTESSIELPLELATQNPNSPNPETVTINELDLSGVTQFGTKFAVSELTQDGYTSGQLTNINISDDGVIMGRYSNGVTMAEGQLVLASFRNTQGLVEAGGNAWVETYESGQPTFGAPTDGNFGSLRAGALEDSNVDLTAELVNMMTAQRTYQANAQTIKTQDQVMSTLINLR